MAQFRGFVLLASLLFLCVALAKPNDPLEEIADSDPHFHSVENGHKCIHDELEQQRKALHGEDLPVIQQDLPGLYEVKVSKEEKKRLLEQRRALLESESTSPEQKRAILQGSRPPHLPLRVYIATDSLVNDPYTCYSTGQNIQVSSGSSTVGYTCRAEDVMTPEKRDYLVNTLMGDAIGWLERSLLVVRTANGYTQLGIGGCTSTPLPVPVPARYSNPGVDADFIMFVTARPIIGGSTLAFASSCAINNIGRPIGGHANFNASNLVDNPLDLPRQSGIAVHEICHALGFSSSRWNSGTFIMYNGGAPNYPYVRLDPDLVVTTINAQGYSFGRLITPTVVRFINEHYGCTTLPGGDLEDSGGQGTAGSHWEKRTFMNEYMTGTESAFPVRSKITLGLFYDSGWYDIDESQGERLLWGRARGCSFYTQDCGNWMSLPNPMPGLCKSVDTSTVQCTFDRRAYGVCNMQQLSNIPPQFVHYGDSSLGGNQAIADYCAFIQGTTWCNTGGKSSQVADVLDIGISANGESFTLSSRCMFSTLNRINAPFQVESLSVVTPPAVKSARCYNTTCVSDTDMRIQVDKVWWACPKGENPIPGFGGVISCPDPSEICAGAPADNTWPLLGTINPNRGPPSTRITITGEFSADYEPYEVQVEFLATDVIRVSDGEIQATLADGSQYVSLTDLALFQTRKNVIVRDNRGYTANREHGFTIEVVFNTDYLRNLFNWMGKNPGWALLIWIILLCPFITCGCILWRVLRKGKKKPKRGDFHENVSPDEYYQDDYEVDDYYNDIYGVHGDGLSPRKKGGDRDDYEVESQSGGAPYSRPASVKMASAPIQPSQSQSSAQQPQPTYVQQPQPTYVQQPQPQAAPMMYAPPAQMQAVVAQPSQQMIYAPPPAMMAGSSNSPIMLQRPQSYRAPPPTELQPAQSQSLSPQYVPSNSVRAAVPAPAAAAPVHNDGLSGSGSGSESGGTETVSASGSAKSMSSGWQSASGSGEPSDHS